MQNMMIIDEKHIQTAYGIFGDVVSYDTYDTGELKSIMLEGENMIVTHAGEIIPAYTETPRRKYKPSVEFYKSGMIRAISLDSQQELNTPIGDFPAELVTFYNSGEIKRIFPLDGKISGFWGEEDEKTLNIPFNFELEFTKFSAMLNCICFYKDGDIRSITLFPGERIDISTEYGVINVRNGFSLYEDGKLQSCEPALPSLIKTRIGKISAYNNDASGISADSNSLNFDKNGKISSLITVSNKIGVQTAKEEFLIYAPQIIAAVSDEDNETVAGLKIKFYSDGVSFNDEEKIFLYEDSGFSVLPFQNGMPMCSPSDCANCSLCKDKGKGKE